jgi:hypothetical protein
MVTYVVKTDLPPALVTKLSIEIFAKWVDFALGHTSLGGKRLVYPSGRYAASLSYQQEGEATVAIVASGPIAEILELGHGQVDLKARLRPGRYRLHRPPGATPGTRLRRIGSGPPGFKAKLWAEIRSREFSGFASLSARSPPGSWIIPPMHAYSPAMILAAQAQAQGDRYG